MPLRNLIRRVAVLIETESSWGCSVIRGIADYAQNHGHWHLLIDPRDHEQRSALPDLWSGDGIIARVGSQLQLDQIRDRKVPTVNIDTVYEGLDDIHDVITDDKERAKIAFNHLRDRGFEKFAYFAPPSRQYSNKRGREFTTFVEEAGFECWEYRPGYRAGRKIGWGEQQRRVSSWLDSLPFPVGIFTVDAQCGRQLAEICHLREIRVPDQVAILAGDTDELMCDVSTPPLSSVSLAGQRIGYEALALIDRVIQGEKPSTEPIKIPPKGIISRHSTDILAIDDETVVQALRFIRSYAFQGIVVSDILREIPVSRRFLEIQFRNYLGRSPAEEIRRVRLEKGKELLSQTTMSINEIAKSCGFANATRFGVAFRKRFNKTPLAYRKQAMKGQGSSAKEVDV